MQQWATTGTGPKTAVAEAWVSVLCGRVALACGKRRRHWARIATGTTGGWMRLTARSGRSPVTVFATAPGGAELLVDSVSVRPTGG